MHMSNDLRKRRKAAKRRVRRERKGVRFLTLAEARTWYPAAAAVLVEQLTDHGLDERAAQFYVDAEGLHMSILFDPGEVTPCDLGIGTDRTR